MAVCRKQRCGENDHDQSVGPSDQSASRDGSSANGFRSTIKPFLIVFAVFGLYTPKWNHHLAVFGNCSIKVALLIHRAYCLGIVIFIWIIIIHGNNGLLQDDFMSSFLYQMIQLITSFQLSATASMFLYGSMRGRYDYMIDAFDIVIVDGFDRLKRFVIAFIIGALLLTFIGIISTILSISSGVVLFGNSYNTTSDVFVSDDLLLMSFFAAIYACFIASFPTVFFIFLCFILSTRFEATNKILRQTLTSDLDTDDLNKKLLGLRTDHANICNAVRHTDNLFSPILFIMFVGTIGLTCMLLYTNVVSEDESAMVSLFGIMFNSMTMMVVVVSSSKVHKSVSNLCYLH